MATYTFVKKGGAPAGTISINVGGQTLTIDDSTNTSIVTTNDDVAAELKKSPVLNLQGQTGGYIAPPVIQDVFTANGVLSYGSKSSPTSLNITPSILSSTTTKKMGVDPANAQTALAGAKITSMAINSGALSGTPQNIPYTHPGFRHNLPVIDNGSGQGQPKGDLQANGTPVSNWQTGGWTTEFTLLSDRMSLRIGASATTRFIRVWVDGLPHAADLVLVSSLSGYTAPGGYYLNIVFPSWSSRNILIEQEDATSPLNWGAMLVPTNARVSSPKTPASRGCITGDSITCGLNGTRSSHGWARQMSRINGLADFWTWTSHPAIGLVRTSGNYGALITRVQDVIDAKPDYVIVPLSVNDAAYTGQNLIGPAVITYVQTLRAALPKALIIGCSPIASNTNSALAAIQTEGKAAFDALGVPFVDYLSATGPLGGPFFFGTGIVGTTTGDGNADIYSDDHTHPNTLGHQDFAPVVAPLFAKALGVNV